ncbi:hypothetical protein HHL11_03170 [Ramlibacter sp. G-1-2-2]|uniref:Uncharacterized protein n=1 Tax=Ramlibacter agri TaxID=2728837 RepID=A0A848GX58_9BURK|nr:hypothetical protein [Ramlibacter agri]NML42737.1 hypothetical protein [Ramlibacter agri]
MLLILLEAFTAMALLIGIVWWTMFSGRKGGEPPRDEDPEQKADFRTQRAQKEAKGAKNPMKI